MANDRFHVLLCPDGTAIFQAGRYAIRSGSPPDVAQKIREFWIFGFRDGGWADPSDPGAIFEPASFRRGQQGHILVSETDIMFALGMGQVSDSCPRRAALLRALGVRVSTH